MRISPEKSIFFEGYSWFRFNNLGLVTAKVSELKVRKFWDQTPPFAEVTREKLIGGRP